MAIGFRCTAVSDFPSADVGNADWPLPLGGSFVEVNSQVFPVCSGLILGDGNQVTIDLCQHFQVVRGPWLRITEPFEFEGAFHKELERFDSEKHGGVLPMDCEIEKFAIEAQDAVDKSSAAIDDALSFVDASNARVSKNEKSSRAASELSADMHRRLRDFQEIQKIAVGREFGSADYAHWEQYNDSQRAIVRRWSSDLSAWLGRNVDAYGLVSDDYPETGIQITFEDGSRVRLMRALLVRRGLLVAVFTPTGHHEYALTTAIDTVSIYTPPSDADRERAQHGVFS